MFNIILVPSDGSALADNAIAAAVKVAKMSGGKLIGLSVAEPYPFAPLDQSVANGETTIYEGKMLESAEFNVRKIGEAAKKANVAYELVVRKSFSPYEEIIATAEKYGCDVIFMASHGRSGLSRLFLGSETQKVLAHSSLPVLVFR